jgi:hypothetical protein
MSGLTPCLGDSHGIWLITDTDPPLHGSGIFVLFHSSVMCDEGGEQRSVRSTTGRVDLGFDASSGFGSKIGLNDPKGPLDFDLQNDHFGPKFKLSQKCPGSSPRCFDDILGSKWVGSMSVARFGSSHLGTLETDSLAEMSLKEIP